MPGRLTSNRDACMERVSIRVPKAYRERIDEAVEDGMFPNRSEAIRAAIGHSFGGDST